MVASGQREPVTGQNVASYVSPGPAQGVGKVGPVVEEEPASAQIGQKASEMASQIELDRA